jgi:hypothetical protein
MLHLVSFFFAFVALVQASWLKPDVGASIKAGAASFLKPQNKDAAPMDMHLQHSQASASIGRTGKEVWQRHEGVYCSDNWNIDNVETAQEKTVSPEECMKHCEANRGCVGVSVTNAGWGDRKPWCHVCKSLTTKPHHNLDTYWFMGLTANELEVRRLHHELDEIAQTKGLLCDGDAAEVSTQQFEKVKQETTLKTQLDASQDNVKHEQKVRLEKLLNEKEAAEKNSKEIGQLQPSSAAEAEKMDAKTKENTAALEKINQEIHMIEVEKPLMAMQQEERHLELEMGRIQSKQKQLKKDAERTEKQLGHVREGLKSSQEKSDEQFWDDWLTR